MSNNRAINILKKAYHVVAPQAEKGDDGRDNWPSRTAFVLACMGGTVGLGNLLRFPSIAFANHGLQWFIPYFMAVIFLAIPVVILEVSIGQAYRGGCLIAYDHISRRTKGLGMALVMNGYIVCNYYVPILAWVMTYFRHSFSNPLPWAGNSQDFFDNDVRQTVPGIPGEIVDGSVTRYTSYPESGMVGEIAGWCAFTWFVVWLCMFNGVGLTGRVVYFTMGLPIVMIIILLGRGVSMENAVDGIKLYVAEWHSEKLGQPAIWQAAASHIFFSIGAGMGYYTSYASYNQKFANAVQDALIIACSNSAIEVASGFSIFGIVGYLGLHPDTGEVLGTYNLAFITIPAAIVQMPASNFWAVLFFFTIMVLGFSSAFAMLESIVTLIMDTGVSKKLPRTAVSTIVVIVSFLVSLIYCTQFGSDLLNAVDAWISDMSLVGTVALECIAATTIYRFRDVTGQVGLPAFAIFNGGYALSFVVGLIIAHHVSAEAGAGAGFGIFIASLVLCLVMARTPSVPAPRFWGGKPILSKFWWLAFYSGNQLRRDLNITIAKGKNWPIPLFWAPVLKYISAPILLIVFSLGYPKFTERMQDPLEILGFAISHCVIAMVILGFLVPRWFDVFIPERRRGEGVLPYAPGVTLGTSPEDAARGVTEAGADINVDDVDDMQESKRVDSGEVDGSGTPTDDVSSDKRVDVDDRIQSDPTTERVRNEAN
ncbi:hypothetical protein PspLS_00938 [Pyricularia sp. CBS 133598]|nr:hypothetical protein PspLS_00938 [Pyricularia sp. CBS 133598]